MKYSKIYRPASKLEMQGKKAEAIKVAKEKGMHIQVEKNGYFVLTSPMQTLVFESDDNGKTIRQADPCEYILESHPEYKKVTEGRVDKLVDQLNKGIVDFDDVCAVSTV
jgi:hypothetical protein